VTGDELAVPPGWERIGERLHRELVFADFGEAFAFMTRVALVAERLDHHPDWSNAWNRVVIDLTTHDAGRLTGRDLRLAEAINAVLAAPATHPTSGSTSTTWSTTSARAATSGDPEPTA
jgi:4a-hydroxytetrahydrobiopterin dehydratase